MQRIIKKVAPAALQQAPKEKRVAAYARVSSGREGPLHSLSAQISYYNSLIQKTPGWQYAGVYADEALTGTKENRAEFQKLLKACHAGEIDMVITKSVSRFARNTVTTLKTIRELRLAGVDVYFEEQNIHTLGEDGEFLLTLLAAYAEEEARSVSENQKWRIKANFEQGIPWSATMYGYRLVDGRLEIVPEEAEVLRLAADLYLAGYGRYKLEDAFAKAGVRGRHGGILSGNSIIGLLCNEKTVGDLLLQKSFRVDPLTKKEKINQGEKPQYFVEESHEPILDRETQRRVIEERARRKAIYKPRSGSYERKVFPFSGKVFCENCGKSFTRKIICPGMARENVIWICRTTHQKGKALCPAKHYTEAVMEQVAAEVMGLPEFDPAIFEKKIQEIRVQMDGSLIYIFRDGHQISRDWEDIPRRMKKKERGLVSCQQ